MRAPAKAAPVNGEADEYVEYWSCHAVSFPRPRASMIAWDVCRDADCSAPPQTYRSRISGLGVWESAFNSVTQMIMRPVSLED